MVNPSRSSRIRWLPLLIFTAAAVILTVSAGLMLFSTFMLYDDEGYVLISLRNFAEHGRLYRDVYSQYGPFSYVLYYLLHLLGMPLTHTAGRLLTLGCWSGAALLGAWVVWRATRHSACMLAAMSAGFVYLWVMVSEPNHPGGVIVFTTALMATLGYSWLAQERWSAWATLAGIGSAVLLLTKINIGVFATLSSVALLLLHSRNARVRAWTPWLIGGGLALLPLALMHSLLDDTWVQTYALLYAFAAIPIAGALSRVVEPRAAGRQWLYALLGGTGVMAVVLGVIFARGTRWGDLMDGMVWGPLRHPGHFSFPIHWFPGVLTLGSGSLGLFLLVLASTRLGRPSRLAIDTVVASLRLVAAAGLALTIGKFPGLSPDRIVFACSLPCLWLFLWPLAGEEPSTVIARSWIGLLFLGQWLHPFPVPGSQIAWGSFLAIPLATIGAWQAAVWLAERHGRVFTFRRSQGLDLTLTFGLVLLAVLTGNGLAQIGTRYFDSRSLDLPGAEPVRLPDSTTALYQLLTVNADAHADMLFSMPGMFSFNLWAKLPTPTLANVTHWFSLLDDAQQRAIIESLEQHPHACLIVEKEHVHFLRAHNLGPTGPLYDYVATHFESAFEIDDFQFQVRRGRQIAPLLTAEMFQQQTTATGSSPARDTLVTMQLLLPPGQIVANVEIAQMDDSSRPPLVLNATNTRVELTPITLEGHGRGQTMEATFPFTLQGPMEVSFYFNRSGRGFSAQHTFFIVHNAAGAELALVRVRL